MKELDKSERRNEFASVNGSKSFNYYRVLLSSSTKLLILKVIAELILAPQGPILKIV